MARSPTPSRAGCHHGARWPTTRRTSPWTPPSPAASARKELRAEILEKVREYHDVAFVEEDFVPGHTALRYAGRVFDHHEVENLVDSSLDFWLTAGRYANEFEKRFAKRFGLRHCLLVNSGSSANLVAFSTLTSPDLGKRRLDEGRRGHHRRLGVPDDGQPDHPERVRAGLRRHAHPDLQHRRLAARGGPVGEDQGGDDRPHARQPVRPRRGPGVLRRAQALARRGLLRRGRLDLRRQAGRHVRRPRDGLASTPPTT